MSSLRNVSACADPGMFVRGGGRVRRPENSLDNVFLVLNLFYRGTMV